MRTQDNGTEGICFIAIRDISGKTFSLNVAWVKLSAKRVNCPEQLYDLLRLSLCMVCFVMLSASYSGFYLNFRSDTVGEFRSMLFLSRRDN